MHFRKINDHCREWIGNWEEGDKLGSRFNNEERLWWPKEWGGSGMKVGMDSLDTWELKKSWTWCLVGHVGETKNDF